MAEITINLPGLLSASTGGKTTLTVAGANVQDVLNALVLAWPALRVHLFDQAGAQREHVLILFNDENIRWFDPAARETSDGDELTILQLVSGG